MPNEIVELTNKFMREPAKNFSSKRKFNIRWYYSILY